MLSKNDTRTSQIEQNRVNKSSSMIRPWLFVMVVVASLFFTAQSAIAANFSNNQKVRKIETYKVMLENLADLEEPRLDWRNPEYEIDFEIPSSDWIEKLDFFVKIHAEGKVNRNAPIYIRFNDGEPTPVYARGNSFDARINLDTSDVKAYRNRISVSFAKDEGCIEAVDGAFSIKMDDSFIVVKASTPSRVYYLKEVKQILNSPLTSPKSISIVAHGPNKLAFEALAAQGIALNMPSLPHFSIGGSSDAQIFIGTRRELASVIRGTEIARRDGPIIGVTRNAPLRLVMTADNQKDLKSLVQSFASKELPSGREQFAYSGEYSWQTPFSVKNKALKGKTPLYELGNLRFDRGWGNGAQSVKFDVDNPLSASGKLKLSFDKSPLVSKESLVNISLNGETLKTLPLSSSRNSAHLDIPRGLLVGTDNILKISPELSPAKGKASCEGDDLLTGFAVRSKSFINIKTEASGFAGDLTRLAASGYPFSSNAGENTAVVLSTSTKSDRAAALRAFAHLAKVYGSGWVKADFYTLKDLPNELNKHALFIGPKFNSKAPRNLAVAVDGRHNVPKTVQTASLQSSEISLLSVNTPARGGILAIYEGKEQGLMNGYLTAARGYSFSRAVDQIVRSGHWNKLQGSVARWDRKKVEMAKTAFKSEAFEAAESSRLPASKGSNFNLSEFSWSELSTMPEIDLAPIGERLNIAAGETVNGFQIIGRGLGVAKTRLLAFIPQSPKKSSPLPLPKHKTVSIPNSDPILVKPSAPAPHAPAGFRINPAKQRPLVQTATTLLQKQYSPGATLRGFAKVSDIPQYTIAPDKTPPNSSGGIKGAFNGVSNWMSLKLEGLLGGPGTGTENRKANLLVFAALSILFLLLLALARPVRYRD